MSGDRWADIPDDDPTIDVLLMILERTADEDLAKVPDILDDLEKCILPLEEVVDYLTEGMNRTKGLIVRFLALKRRIRAVRLIEGLKDAPGTTHDGPPDG